MGGIIVKHKVRKLHDFLKRVPPGSVPIELINELVELLSACWHEFDGGKDSKMASHKIERMEDPEWKPPVLSFIIERHGATVNGSTRAELQKWVLNLVEGTASHGFHSYRQLYPRDAPWRGKPVGEELAKIVIVGEEDTRLKWLSEDKDWVRILTPNIIPNYYFSPKMTLSYRRSKFYEAMDNILEPAGWLRSGNMCWKKAIA